MNRYSAAWAIDQATRAELTAPIRLPPDPMRRLRVTQSGWFAGSRYQNRVALVGEVLEFPQSVALSLTSMQRAELI